MALTTKSPRKSLLVVEDNAEIRKLLTEKLTHLGYRVLSGSTSTDALRLISNQKFDCILLDITLEKGNGKTIVQSLRAEKMGFNHATPVLIVSGTLTADVVTEIADKVSGFYVKPLEMNALIEKVKVLCPLPPGLSP